ncbi:EF-hand domain-containing protein [Kriegella aquimaris]|nr:hypothetical protein [Kriegella aquimaris]
MMKKTCKTGLKLGLIVSFFAFNGYAQPSQNNRGNQEPPSAEEIIKQMDKDEDGKLSKKEVKGPLKNDFAKIDANEDGFISKEEIEKAPKPKRQGRQ